MQSTNSDQLPGLDWGQLAMYFTGECSAEERQAIEQWLEANPEYHEEIARIRTLWRASWHERVVRDVDANIIWTGVMEQVGMRPAMAFDPKLHQTIPQIPPTPMASRVTQNVLRNQRWAFPKRSMLSQAAHYWPLGIVAALCVVLTNRYIRSSQLDVSPFPAMIRSATLPGQRAQVTLPDGTIVTLNVSSQLEIPRTFSRDNRTVYLTGEALFTVVHQAGAPLTVMTGSTATKVLGTTFTVRRYASDTATTVAVREGKVSVQSVVVTAGQEVVAGVHGLPTLRTVQEGRFTYANGILTLPWMPLSDALVELERWANVRIRLADPGLAQRRVRLSVPEVSPSDLSVFLETVLGVRVMHEKDTLTLYAND